MSMSRRQLAIALGAVAAAQGAAYLLYRQVTGERAAARDSSFAYETVDGAEVGLEARVQHRDGREVALRTMLGGPLLLHFWATWCEPCRAELPQLLGLEEPTLLLVSTDEAWPVVEHFFDGKPPTTVVLDARGEARRSFGVATLPDTYLLDATGRARARFHGPRAWGSASARSTLRRLLKR